MARAHEDGVPRLVPFREARERVLSRIRPLAPIDLPLSEAYGCVSAADVPAPKDLPEFASSAMDGFAVRAEDVATAAPDAPVELRATGRVAMGTRPEVVVGPGEAVAIATGAPIPAGADCVVPIEQCAVQGERVLVLRPVPLGKHVRPAAEDVRVGEVLVPAGRRLGAPELGLLAAAGFSQASVFPKPRVVVISTGDELVEPGRSPSYGQVHDSNSFMLAGAIRESGATPFVGGIVRDSPDSLKEEVLSHLATADAFVSSGGVSVGERDVVKAAFLHDGDVEFFKVAMQPGMPQGFGLIEGKPYFGMPGNPVSAFVSFEVFVRPALLKMMGRRRLFRPEIPARLEGELAAPPDKTLFARVLVRRDEHGAFVATPTGPRGSNLLSTVARANGLAIVPPGAAPSSGQECRVMVFRSLED